MRDPKYDILFESVTIGPKVAKNRFYQVPHCSGMGYMRPQTLAHMRGMKAEGGWGVVNTEYCSVHPTMDANPYPYAANWDDSDVKAHARMVEAVHEHGALAGIELCLFGNSTSGQLSRQVGMDLTSTPYRDSPWQTRAMDKSDFAMVRRWHKQAALRSIEAGFDIVYVYATHSFLLTHVLSSVTNQRSDEYGGSLENRVRLVREIIEDTKDAVGDKAAVAVRFSADQGGHANGEIGENENRDILAMLAELPDLWDIVTANYDGIEMASSRLVQEGALEQFVSYVKTVTSKPVVSVGRFTSPDTMVGQIKRGVLDMIGAARPSIADPFLPKKIEEGRMEDIRECIGCNICYASNSNCVPIRCTQNPTMGEEWRSNWHPEIMPAKKSDDTILIVGGGPAGLEAARALGLRGYDVVLAESKTELGGRVSVESSLVGLSEYARVRDYRMQQFTKLPNVNVYLDSHLDGDGVMEFGFNHVILATGSTWRADGVGRTRHQPFDGHDLVGVRSPNDVMGQIKSKTLNLAGPILIWDDDDYYMASVLALTLHQHGLDVTLAVTKSQVGYWTNVSGEQWNIQRQLVNEGIKIHVEKSLGSFDGKNANLTCNYLGEPLTVKAHTVIPVTSRNPNDSIYHDLMARQDQWESAGIKSVRRIGDCEAPGIIAQATYAGHQVAYKIDNENLVDDLLPFEREHPKFPGVVTPTWA